MRKGCWLGLGGLVAVGFAVTAVQPSGARGQWPQWGGPDRNFTVETSNLARSWPKEGPPKLWRRELGEGYSAIVADGGRLYTMYRADGREIVVCLDAQTGRTVWEHAYESSPPPGHVADYGDGPNATPLLAAGRLYAIGVAGVMHCLTADSGKVLWSHNLLAEFGGNVLESGYSSSPIAYQDTVIALVGGKGQAVVAFNAKDGGVAWKNLDFRNSYSTPQILKIAGQDQLVTYMEAEVIGADPVNGELEWRYPIVNQWKQNIALPMLAAGDVLYITSLLAGSRGLELSRSGSKFDVEELWSIWKIQNFFGTAVALGDYAYTSTGSAGATFIAAVNMGTGKIAWRKRGFARANLIYADGLFIILDEGGNLALATASPDDFTVLSRFKLLDAPAWTVPTLVGRTLYLRDRKQIMALDLGASRN